MSVGTPGYGTWNEKKWLKQQAASHPGRYQQQGQGQHRQHPGVRHPGMHHPQQEESPQGMMDPGQDPSTAMVAPPDATSSFPWAYVGVGTVVAVLIGGVIYYFVKKRKKHGG